MVKEHIAPILHIKYPQTAKAYNTPSRGISLLPHLPVSKKLPEEQIFCGADPLGAQALCHVLLVSSPFLFIYYFYIFFIILAQLSPINALAQGLTLYHPFLSSSHSQTALLVLVSYLAVFEPSEMTNKIIIHLAEFLKTSLTKFAVI